MLRFDLLQIELLQIDLLLLNLIISRTRERLALLAARDMLMFELL
jgi:hypothetical protein